MGVSLCEFESRPPHKITTRGSFERNFLFFFVHGRRSWISKTLLRPKIFANLLYGWIRKMVPRRKVSGRFPCVVSPADKTANDLGISSQFGHLDTFCLNVKSQIPIILSQVLNPVIVIEILPRPSVKFLPVFMTDGGLNCCFAI